MKSIRIIVRTGVGILILMIVLLLAMESAAASLQGTVQGKTGAPKGFVRVDVYGPENKRVFTDQEGKFIVDVREGEYTVQISERDRVVAFKIRLPREGKRETFVLEWR